MKVTCFGEILWDCLPGGNFLGGAPFNVAFHLQRLGAEPVVVSALGQDELGRQALERLHALGIATDRLSRHHDLPTGTVSVKLDAQGNASYVFADPAAWDKINPGKGFIADAAGVVPIVFGSLALRHEFNRRVLKELLEVRGALRVFDVNLRPPHGDVRRVLALAEHADVLKVNDKELARLTGVESYEHVKHETFPFLKGLERLERLTGVRSICVTRGAHGAIWRLNGEYFEAAAPAVKVVDTIGAGDAFTAALVVGVFEKKLSPAELLARACRLGSFVASQPGAQPEYEAAKVFTNSGWMKPESAGPAHPRLNRRPAPPAEVQAAHPFASRRPGPARRPFARPGARFPRRPAN
ncbi:MAG: carbohydrate kinase [Verrucomicrobia bacterium]|nr:carbohydrate kinase [Verrucomicrobiota bacterium]